MAKFCKKCGSKLVDEKCPNCKDEKSTTPVEGTTSVDFKESLMDCLNIVKKIFTKPFQAVEEFVTENKYITGIIMIVLTALSTGLYKIATLKNMYSSNSSIEDFNTSDLSNLVSSALSGNLSKVEPDYLKEFMTTFVTNLAEYALIVVIGYFVITKIFKGSASLKAVVSAVGISLAFVLCAHLLNSILVFIDGEFIANLRSYVFSFTGILSTLILCSAVKKVAGITKEMLFITVASMSVLATVVIDICEKIFNK